MTFDPEDPRLAARSSDPETSHEAAESLEQRRLKWDLIVGFVTDNPRPEGWTDWEIHRALPDVLGDCWWKRISECRHNGWLVWLRGEDGKVVKRPGQFPQKRGANVLATSTKEGE